MKIKVKNKAYSEVIKIDTGKRHVPHKQSRFFRWLMKTLAASELKDIDFEYSTEAMDKLRHKEPALYLMNHSSFTDLQIASTLLADRKYHIVCTNDGFVGKEWLMNELGCIPAAKFINDLNLVKSMKYCFEKLHSSVLMYPEASYSFDGTQTPLPDSLGKCIKLMKVPVVMIRTKGAFLRDPLYNNLQKRKCKVTAKVKYLLSAEEIDAMTPGQINELLAKEFTYDHFREQYEDGVTINEPFRADGLHRVLYKCPACGCEGSTLGKGISLTCSACGKTYTLLENGLLEADRGVTEFNFIPDWYAWERECVRKEIEDNTYCIEEAVDILMYMDNKAIYRVGKGILKQTAEGFHLTGCDGELDYSLKSTASYSLYSDYFWYEIGDMISIGDRKMQFYCFPAKDSSLPVAKARLAAEEAHKLQRNNQQNAKERKES